MHPVACTAGSPEAMASVVVTATANSCGRLAAGHADVPVPVLVKQPKQTVTPDFELKKTPNGSASFFGEMVAPRRIELLSQP